MKLQTKKEKLVKILKEFQKCDNSEEYFICEDLLRILSKGDKKLESNAYDLLKIFNEAITTSKDTLKEYMEQYIDDDLLICKLFDLYNYDILNIKKEKFRQILQYVHDSGKSIGFVVCDRTIEEYSNGDKEVEAKVYNFLKIINEAKQTSKEAYDKLVDRDIETDIWYAV